MRAKRAGFYYNGCWKSVIGSVLAAIPIRQNKEYMFRLSIGRKGVCRNMAEQPESWQKDTAILRAEMVPGTGDMKGIETAASRDTAGSTEKQGIKSLRRQASEGFLHG